ncbi:unnamed protein product [Merluccius merluccius]
MDTPTHSTYMEVSYFAGIAGKKKEAFEIWTLERKAQGNNKLPKVSQGKGATAQQWLHLQGNMVARLGGAIAREGLVALGLRGGREEVGFNEVLNPQQRTCGRGCVVVVVLTLSLCLIAQVL